MPIRDEGAAASRDVFARPGFEEAGSVDPRTDHALMQAVAVGDEQAFKHLMRRHVQDMVPLARRITLNAHDADEIVQEAFLRVWINAPKWKVDGPASFRTWLHRIVTNLAIDKRRKPRLSPLEDAGDPADPAVDIASDLERSEEAHHIRQALAKLPPRQRAAIALCYFDDMSSVEAAQILDLSVGAVDALLNRARKRLRQIFASSKVVTKGDAR